MSEPTETTFVQRDHQLEALAGTATRALMHHRWHWTLDDSNQQRMTFVAYADAVGKHHSLIARYAHAHTLLGDFDGAVESPNEALERAAMGVERQAATQAIAEARGIAFATVRKDHAPETRHVQEMARNRAEERGTTPVEEIPHVAQMFVRAEQADQRREAEHEEHHGLRFVQMENDLDSVKRKLIRIAQDAETLELDEQHRDLLAHTIDNVRRLLNLLDQTIIQGGKPDWGELRMIEGGTAS